MSEGSASKSDRATISRHYFEEVFVLKNQEIRMQDTSTIDNQISHLRNFIKREIQQKMRVEKSLVMYRRNYDDLTETVVDESYLMRKLEAELQTEPDDSALKEQLNNVTARRDHGLNIKEELETLIADLVIQQMLSVNTLHAHQLELTNLSFMAGQFIAHVFGIRDGVKVDEATSTLTLTEGTSVEASIATELTKWKDSSQMSIIKKERK